VDKYAADTEKQQKRLEATKQEKAEYTQNTTPANKWIAAFSRFMDAKKLTFELAQAMIERIEVSDRDMVTVTFKFRDEMEAVCQNTDVKKYAEVS